MFPLATMIKTHSPHHYHEAMTAHQKISPSFCADMKKVVAYITDIIQQDLNNKESSSPTNYTPDKWALLVGKITGMDTKLKGSLDSLTLEVWIALSRLSYTPPGNLFAIKNSQTQATLHSKLWCAAKLTIGSGTFHTKSKSKLKQQTLSWTVATKKPAPPPKEAPPKQSPFNQATPTVPNSLPASAEQAGEHSAPNPTSSVENVVSPDRPADPTPPQAWPLIKTKPTAHTVKQSRKHTQQIIMKTPVTTTVLQQKHFPNL